MDRYRIIINRFTYGRGWKPGMDAPPDTGIEYSIQAYWPDNSQHFVVPVRVSPDDFNVKLAEVMLMLERRCMSSTSKDSPAKQTPTPHVAKSPLPQTASQHVCGLTGFGNHIDDFCPACREGK